MFILMEYLDLLLVSMSGFNNGRLAINNYENIEIKENTPMSTRA